MVVVGGRHTDLSVTLVNPTSCPGCNPWEGLDALRVEVWRGEEVVASDMFSWPEETPELPDLDGFGVVRITLAGLADGRVRSGGRTPEIALVPDEALSVPMVFLPVNEALPLDAPMASARSRHGATRLPDGSVLLVGGHVPTGDRSFDTLERFDLLTGAFEAVDAELPIGVGDPRLAWNREGDLFIVGGAVARPDGDVPVQDVSLWDRETGTLSVAASMTTPRADPCLAFYRQRQGLVLGGATDSNVIDYLHPADGDGDWEFLGISTNLFLQDDIVGCTELPDDRVYIQGVAEDATGIWDHSDDADPADAFLPLGSGVAGDARYARGAMITTLDDGRVWMGGGELVATETVDAGAVVFDAETRRFGDAGELGRGRVLGRLDRWWMDGWYVVGCGWQDALRETPEDSLEVRSLVTGDAAPVVDFERTRPGCSVTTLPDGSVLVAGGFSGEESGGSDAAVVVPWAEIE